MTIVKLISLLLLLSNPVFAVDIVQIDVGTEIEFTGILIMPKNIYAHESHHGTHMALALEDELKKQGSQTVTAKQVVWDYAAHSRASLLNAYKEAFIEAPLIISLSLGGPKFDPVEEALMQANTLNDTVIVAAAGNDGGGTNYFPANYLNPCILSVGTTVDGYKATYSNQGQVWLEYNEKDPPGTSASTARMAAIVLQVRRQNPKMTCENVVLTIKMLYGKMH